MLKNLLELVKENAGEAIINNPAVPNEQNDAVIATASDSLFKALKGTAKTGGVNTIKDLFQQGGSNAASNPTIKTLSSGVAGDLMKKFGLDKVTANQIVTMLIPIVMSKLISKTNDPGDKSFNLDGIIGALAGKKTGGLFGTLKGLLGK